MVYQSTQLVIKTEQHNQAQFCTPLRADANTTATTASLITNSPITLHTLQQQQQGQQNVAQNFSVNNLVTMQTPNQSTTTTSINKQYLMTNIKREFLPPSLTLYPTASTSTTATSSTSASFATTLPTTAPTPTTTIKPAVSITPAGRKATSTTGIKPQFKCEQCGMTFGSKSAHTSHTKSHIKNGELSLLGSQQTVATSIEVNEAGIPLGIPKTPQIKANPSANGGDPYQCNVCQKTFAVPARLIRHYRTHTGERPFECEFCHKLFSVKENLQVHRRIHTKERPYKCDVCGRAFEHSGKLHRHMRIHTGERPHKCSVCEKTFIQSGQLVIHMRTHTGEKPYKCPVEGCGKGFTCSKQLKVHSRTHTGEKPYHCDICFRDFGYNHVLKLHRVQHYGSKCYKCTICDETFKSKKEMEAHIKGHANEMPDDEDENATTSTAIAAVSAGESTTSAPSSPQSPTLSVVTKTRKPRARNNVAATTTTLIPNRPPSPSSPSSTMSPSSSLASASRLSTGSPSLTSVSSPSMSLTLETEYQSRDSGITNSANQINQHMTSNLNATNMLITIDDSMSYRGVQDLPTDLSMQQQTASAANYYDENDRPSTSYISEDNHHTIYQQRIAPETNYVEYIQHPTPSMMHHIIPQQLEQQQQPQQHMQLEAPTINPALLEAACIASQRESEPNGEEEMTQAALQIMQLNRSQHHHNHHHHHHHQQHQHHHQHQNQQQHQQEQHEHDDVNHKIQTIYEPHHSDVARYDDTQEANELIARYKRGELARHGLHSGYAPVPEYKSLIKDDLIVRQVEAAIAPLRSSTESPERSSSPESDSMLMADRDVMTLPLRKRKLYNNYGANEATMGTKVVRESSVIQFAKAPVK